MNLTNDNIRRFGTAKRLNEIMNFNKYFESVGVTVSHAFFSFPSFCLRMPIGDRGFKTLHSTQHALTFGSAKPTGAKPSRRVGLLAHRKDRLWN